MITSVEGGINTYPTKEEAIRIASKMTKDAVIVPILGDGPEPISYLILKDRNQCPCCGKTMEALDA